MLVAYSRTEEEMVCVCARAGLRPRNTLEALAESELPSEALTCTPMARWLATSHP